VTIHHTLLDVVAWLSALLATWFMYRWRFRERLDRFSTRLGAGYFAAISIGGLAGAFGFGTLNAYLSGQPLIARSVLGGLAGAIALVEVYKRRTGIVGSTGAVFSVPFCLAITIGRLGCFQAGLDDMTHGTATGLPWGVDFGDAVKRHPVQLYESITMATAGLVLLAGIGVRSRFFLANAFYLAVGIYGLQRFFWEFLKPYGSIMGPLNLFHLLCLALCVYAVWMIYSAYGERT
jgi:phosphatidylglycerol:prolipoprotein diacylglycerol transferase